MLSPTSTVVIQQTLPVVGAAIDEITQVFYPRLFGAHPELLANLFNRNNQAQGDQQRALAASIARYATLLLAETEGGPAPRAVLARIAHKHASLGVLEEHYPIVHEHLFAAIVEVLGEAVTPEVAAAWDEVYWLMAHDLIALEKELYAAAGVEPGQVWRELVVTQRRQESPDTITLVLADPTGAELPPARAGQYVSVQVPLPDGAQQIRQYSLVRVEDAGVQVISVKAIPATRDGDRVLPAGEVSQYLHHQVFEGDTLKVSAPFGELALSEADTPVVLVSAGIGITPMIGFLHALADDAEREVLVMHADRSPAQHAHRAELAELVAAHPRAQLVRWYEALGNRSGEQVHEGLVDLAGVELPADADVYLCGPVPFMGSVNQQLLARGVASDRIHYEVFGPARELASA